MTTDKGNDLRALIDQQEPGFMQKALAATAVARPTTDNETVLREALGRCVAALKEAHYTGHEVNGHEMHDAAILAGVEALSRPASVPEEVVEAILREVWNVDPEDAQGVARRILAALSSVSVDEGERLG